MKLKCRKIPGIEKSICTAEQKIAYNYAFSCYELGKKILSQDLPEFVKSEYFNDITLKVIKNIQNNPELSKYNIDCIIVAFRQGFKKYCTNYFIATNYTQIGKCFAIPYDII